MDKGKHEDKRVEIVCLCILSMRVYVELEG